MAKRCGSRGASSIATIKWKKVVVGWVSFFSCRFSVRYRRSCGIDTRKKKIVVTRVKWRNHIQDLMHPPWSFLARGQPMRGARSVDSMHCWFTALWISCIYDHFSTTVFLFYYCFSSTCGNLVNLVKRADSKIDNVVFILKLVSLFYFFLHLSCTQLPHINLTLDQLQQHYYSALVQKDVILFDHLKLFHCRQSCFINFMMYASSMAHPKPTQI